MTILQKVTSGGRNDWYQWKPMAKWYSVLIYDNVANNPAYQWKRKKMKREGEERRRKPSNIMKKNNQYRNNERKSVVMKKA